MIKIIRSSPPLRITIRRIIRHGFSFLRPRVMSKVPVGIMVWNVTIALHQCQFLLVAEIIKTNQPFLLYFRLFGPGFDYHFGSSLNNIFSITFFWHSFLLSFLYFQMGFFLHFFKVLFSLLFLLFVWLIHLFHNLLLSFLDFFFLMPLDFHGLFLDFQCFFLSIFDLFFAWMDFLLCRLELWFQVTVLFFERVIGAPVMILRSYFELEISYFLATWEFIIVLLFVVRVMLTKLIILLQNYWHWLVITVTAAIKVSQLLLVSVMHLLVYSHLRPNYFWLVLIFFAVNLGLLFLLHKVFIDVSLTPLVPICVV